MKIKKKFAISASLLMLVGCGGGSATNVDPQGYWVGPSSTGYTVSAAILENGESWGIYSSGSTIYGALYGSTSTDGSSITVAGSDFNFVSNSVASNTLTGTVAAKSSISAVSQIGTTVSLSYLPEYETAATSSAIVGTWNFIGRSRSYSLIPGTIVVDGAGSFTLNQTNCVTSGSVVPRSGGKNIYNLTLSSTGSGCVAGQSSMSGIAILDTSVTPNKFLSLALTPSKGDGVIVIGTR
jgi:hypothetical protein